MPIDISTLRNKCSVGVPSATLALSMSANLELSRIVYKDKLFILKISTGKCSHFKIIQSVAINELLTSTANYGRILLSPRSTDWRSRQYTETRPFHCRNSRSEKIQGRKRRSAIGGRLWRHLDATMKWSNVRLVNKSKGSYCVIS